MIQKAAVPVTVVPPPKRTPLASVKPGKVDAPWKILLHGPPGVGKTTFGAHMPDPMFLCAEKSGADELSVRRYPDPIGTFAELREALHRLTDEPHDAKSLVIDTIDDLEPLVWAEVIRKDGKSSATSTIEDVGGGYQKGYNVAIDEWRLVVGDLERLQEKRGMHVLLIAHTTRREFKSANTINYDRWEPNIHKKASGFLVGWCKDVLFANEEIAAAKLDGKHGKSKALSTGIRILRTRLNPAYDAKNRHNLPDPLPLEFAAFADAMSKGEVETPEVLREAIAAKLALLDEADTTAKVEALVKKAGEDASELAVIDNRMSATLEARGKKEQGNE